ncbi:MAG: maleylacetoacetate isomerase [Pseudomonadota bacterium]
MKLFGYWRSSATYRVRIALALKNLDYDYQPVNLLKGEQKSDAHLARNPLGLVPAFETDDGAILTQSLAIVEYLEETCPDPSLLPGGAVARAYARAITATLASEAQPFGNLRIQKYLRETGGFDDEAMTDWMNQWPGGAMAAVEKMLERTAGDFCVGDTPGLADCFLIPQVYASLRFNVNIAGLKNVNAIYARCQNHPAFQKAHPDNQPDAVTN